MRESVRVTVDAEPREPEPGLWRTHRAGGTDLSKRFRTDVSRGSFVDVRDFGDLERIPVGYRGGVRIGSLDHDHWTPTSGIV